MQRQPVILALTALVTPGTIGFAIGRARPNSSLLAEASAETDWDQP